MVVVVMGPAGAGKTTVGRALAAALGCPYYEGDDYHAPHSVRRMRDGHALDDAERVPWLAALAAVVARCVADGTTAVLACSALRQRYRAALVPPDGARDVRFVYLRASPALLAARLGARVGHFFAPGLLTSQLAALEEPEGDEPAPALVVDASAPADELVAAITAALGLTPAAPGDGAPAAPHGNV